MKNSIVIPTYGRIDLVEKLLKGLEEHEANNIDEVLIVDDAYPDSSGLTIAQRNSSLPVSIHKNLSNRGFTISSNIGLQTVVSNSAAGAEHAIFLISSDVAIWAPFIEQAKNYLFGGRRHLIGNRHIVFNTGWNTFDGVVFDYLEGWFLGATSGGWSDLGYFDENYSPYDFEDVDISTVAKRKGYKLTPLNNPKIIHLGGGTIGFNPARETITKRNREYFKWKWMRS